ncbi:hypothetical protein BDV96DRAFT_689303 [Lophiotrema nucula]|uniref:Hypersensitive response-inducing protein n=1 Tax=Lophiotrema nucula TaxID=690887 RepID=A0A6A5Z292_9PLEO|nr:hypothetical protein BDV96DRAFT_689303 [Lophiotrema nucula]
MVSKISVVALLAVAALAVPAPSTSSDRYVWTVSGYINVCTAATCYYVFNVTGEAGPSGAPSFDASGCSGNSLQYAFKSCATLGIDVPGDVTTDEKSLGNRANVFVKLAYKKDGVAYTVTGNETTPNGKDPRVFNIYPDAISAVPDKV